MAFVEKVVAPDSSAVFTILVGVVLWSSWKKRPLLSPPTTRIENVGTARRVVVGPLTVATVPVVVVTVVLTVGCTVVIVVVYVVEVVVTVAGV